MRVFLLKLPSFVYGSFAVTKPDRYYEKKMHIFWYIGFGKANFYY